MVGAPVEVQPPEGYVLNIQQAALVGISPSFSPFKSPFFRNGMMMIFMLLS